MGFWWFLFGIEKYGLKKKMGVLGIEHPADLKVIQQKCYSSGAESGALLKLIESLSNLTPFQRSEIEMIIRGGSK